MGTVLITGGGGGIGGAVARQLAARGDTPVVADIELDRASSVATGIAGASAIELDVADPDECERAVDRIVAQSGGIDGVVCCAAVLGYDSAIELTQSTVERTFGVNVLGSLFPCQAAARWMIDAGRGGAMVLFSSAAATRTIGTPAYSASKAAVESLMRELALAWAPHGIRVNAIAPGAIDTQMSRAAQEEPETIGWLMAHTPLARIGRPSEVAAVVAFLMSDAASFVNASVVAADGGFVSR